MIRFNSEADGSDATKQRLLRLGIPSRGKVQMREDFRNIIPEDYVFGFFMV